MIDVSDEAVARLEDPLAPRPAGRRLPVVWRAVDLDHSRPLPEAGRAPGADGGAGVDRR